jgi:hypothetical protein
MDRADRDSFAQQRCNEIGSDADSFINSLGPRKFGLDFRT